MKTIIFTAFMIAAISLVAAQRPALAQGPNSSTKTSSRMLYHNGPVRTYIQDVYFIFYGCWETPACGPFDGDAATMTVLTNFMSSIGNTPYMFINNTYPDSTGTPATSALVYGGSIIDNSYAHGNELTQADIEAILNDHIGDPGGQTDLPADPQGIYFIISTADVSSTATGFCVQGAPPFHSFYRLYGTNPVPYGFIGDAHRCPTLAGPQFLDQTGTRLTTPNGSYDGDSMVATLAHELNGILTDPYGTGWFDRYGLENADKCSGTFGTTYTTSNGARANIHLSGNYDYLIEQNWINGRKGRCAMYQ